MKRAGGVEQHFTPAEVCERLAISRRTLFSMIRPGPGGIWPVVRLNARNIRVPASSVARALAGATWEPKGLKA